MADTSKPISDVAGVGAEFPMAVAVDGECFPAGRAGKGVDRFPLHQLQMCVPPLVPAGITAEPFPLPPRILIDRPAALLADCAVCPGGQTVPPTE